MDADDDEDDDDVDLGAGARQPPLPEVDFDVDAIAADLQSAAGRRAAPPQHEDAEDPELAEETEIEELDELLEIPEESTQPRRLYLVLDGRAHPVTTDRFVIGRVSSQCDLAIIDANVSRQHCAIERREGLFFVVDLGSTNGVEIDGVRVDNHAIEAGDVLVLSGHRIECTFEPPQLDPPEPLAEVATPAPYVAAVTGRMPAVPIARAPAPAPEPEPEPELDPEGALEPELDPEGALEPETEPEMVAHVPEPATFEARVELRLATMAADLARLAGAVQRLVEQVEALKGVDALAQVIQRRLEQAKRGG